MTQITGKIYQQTNAAGTENRFPRTVMEAVLGLNSYLQNQFSSLANIYMPIEGINQAKPNQEFVYRQTPNTINAKALTLDSIKGKTLAWNQQYTNAGFSTSEESGVTYEVVDSATWKINGSASAVNTKSFISESNIISGHKYYVSIGKSITGLGFRYYGTEFDYGTKSAVITGVTIGSNVQFYHEASASFSNVVVKPVFTDLTRLYGSDIDGMTDAQILAKYESEYGGHHAYNPGALISNDAESIETVGFNLWDEEWEVGAYNNHGVKIISNFQIRCKNPIPCFPSTAYKETVIGEKSNTTFSIFFLDAEGNSISESEVENTTFTTPSNCHYFVFCTATAYYGTTYKNDICINISDPSRNGQYEPYCKSVLPLNLKKIRVISPNIWDEEWEEFNGGIRGKNYFDVVAGETYYIKCPASPASIEVQIGFFDINNNPVENEDGYTYRYNRNGYTIVPPAGCSKFKILHVINYGTTYNHDICINKSDPGFNGKYFPHGILTIEGGLKGAGSVYDEIVGNKYIKRVGREDLATLSWSFEGSSNTYYINGPAVLLGMKLPVGPTDVANAVSQFYEIGSDSEWTTGKFYISHTDQIGRTTLSGDTPRGYLDYELANEEVYDLAEPIPMSMPAGTTEARISPNADSLSAPFCADITYGMGATEYAETAGVALNAISTQYAEATARLLNARTIWGQSFDGSQNITGALSGVTNIDSLAYFDTTNGRIGIGTSSPSYNLHVSGTFKANGNSEFGGNVLVGGEVCVPYSGGLSFYGDNDLWLASLGYDYESEELILSAGVDNDHVLLHDGNYTSYSPSLTQFNTSNGVLAEGIASNASRLDSLEDWLTDPRLTSLYSDSLSADSLNVPGNATLGAVTATSLACAALSGVGNINSKIYFSGANVGIAQSSPSYGLDVSGTFRATGNSVIGGTLGVTGKLTGFTAEFESVKPSNTEYDSEYSINIPLWRLEDDGEAEFGDTYIRGALNLRDYYEGEFYDGSLQYDYQNDVVSCSKPFSAPTLTQSSDQRLKTNLSPVALTVEQIASAPAVEFNWIGNGQRGAGSIAQYWENTLPYNVHHSGETLTMEYGNIALLSAITCAREIQKLEARIKELEAKLNQ